MGLSTSIYSSLNPNDVRMNNEQSAINIDNQIRTQDDYGPFIHGNHPNRQNFRIYYHTERYDTFTYDQLIFQIERLKARPYVNKDITDYLLFYIAVIMKRKFNIDLDAESLFDY